jgi:hypothetical protein
MRIAVANSKIITRRNLFSKKERFHKAQAKLPFPEKVKILIQLQRIAKSIRGGFKKTEVWYQ